MASKKISELTAILNSGLSSGDLLPVVDISASANKKIALSELDLRWEAPTTALSALVSSLNTLVQTKNLSLVTTSGAHSVASQSAIIFCNATTGNQSHTLPAVVDGLEITFKKIDSSSNTVTISGTIEGVVDSVIDQQYTARTVVGFNGAWYWRD